MENLKELNITAEETDKLKKALKNEEFMRLFGEYVNEISDPENMKTIEAELTALEQDRGNKVDFYHPVPFRALRTSVNGEQKCYINIGTNDKVGKPESTWKEDGDGRPRPCWSLPHVIHPDGGDLNSKGNKIKIYDVMFHPDIVHLASKGEAFMAMVDSVAIDAIQNVFKVAVDKNNVRVLKIKYKGTPRSCVIRTPIPGYKPKDQDPLAFPNPPVPSVTKPIESPVAKDSSDAGRMQPQGAKGPTEPHYSVKYVSYVDLQDFRCSRDSAQSPRPKEIVVTINMPLLKAATDANLEVKERLLLLESKTPAYRLELPLAYPVDEDKGKAKFNKLRGQLTVTLPVLPYKEVLDFTARPDVRDDEDEESKRSEEDESKKSDEDEESKRSEEDEESKKSEKDEESKKSEEDEESKKSEENEESKKSEGEETKKSEDEETKKSEENEESKKSEEDESKKGDEDEESMKSEEDEESKNSEEDEESKNSEEDVENLLPAEDCELVASPETEQPGGVHGSEKVETDAAFLRHSPSEESQAPDAQGRCSPEEPSVIPAASDKVTFCSEDDSVDSAKRDGEHLPMEQTCQEAERNHKPPPVILREIDADGNVTIISDHSTSAAFVFQNSLLYELD